MLVPLRSFALSALLLASSPALADPPPSRHQRETAEPGHLLAPEPVPAPAAPVVQDYEPDPAMWRLADEDTTLYFFGTYHVLPEGFRWRTPLLEQVIAEADEVVFESRSEDEEDIDFEAVFGGSALDILARPPVSDKLSETNREKWARIAEQMELPFFVFDRMPPSLTLLFIGVTASELEGSQSELGVETILEEEFRAAGKPILAIEDPAAVLRNVLAIDEAFAIRLIDESLTEWDGESLVTMEDGEVVTDWSMEHDWARGDLDSDDFEEWTEDPFGEALYKVLLVDRNRAWADWIAARMEQPGTVLVAVGAGHFAGPDSVQAMAAAKGLTIERLNRPVPRPAGDGASAVAAPAE